MHEPLLYGKYYHIYNRGINGENLFQGRETYTHFLQLYEKYVDPVANTYAWVLMPNHFHFLVRIKEEAEVGFYKAPNTDRSVDTVRSSESSSLSVCLSPDSVKNIKKPKPEKYFSHLFNAYTKYYNTKFNRHGSLYERSFKRKSIKNKEYLKKLVVYIHNNPVRHRYSICTEEYRWSSYLACITDKPTKLKRDIVLSWFNSLENFKKLHEEYAGIKEVMNYFDN